MITLTEPVPNTPENVEYFSKFVGKLVDTFVFTPSLECDDEDTPLYCLMFDKIGIANVTLAPWQVCTLGEGIETILKGLYFKDSHGWRIIYVGTQDRCVRATELFAETLGVGRVAPDQVPQDKVAIVAVTTIEAVEMNFGSLYMKDEEDDGDDDLHCLMFDTTLMKCNPADEPWLICGVGETAQHNIAALYGHHFKTIGKEDADWQVVFAGTKKECEWAENIFVRVLGMGEYDFPEELLKEEV